MFSFVIDWASTRDRERFMCDVRACLLVFSKSDILKLKFIFHTITERLHTSQFEAHPGPGTPGTPVSAAQSDGN